MPEIRHGIFNVLRKILGGNSAILALTYTLGHIIIAMTCNYFITGAQLQLAAVDALVEPIINGFWFYILHTLWKRFQK